MHHHGTENPHYLQPVAAVVVLLMVMVGSGGSHHIARHLPAQRSSACACPGAREGPRPSGSCKRGIQTESADTTAATAAAAAGDRRRCCR